ncbi:DUF732 domain-containing protein [Nocardia sp. NPDC055321]
MTIIRRLAGVAVFTALATAAVSGVAAAAPDEAAYLDAVAAALPAFSDGVRTKPDAVLQDGYKVCAALGHGIAAEELATAMQSNVSRDSRGRITITDEQARLYIAAAQDNLCPTW